MSSGVSSLPIQQEQQESFRFTGSGEEYFRIWIVNLFLSILTLGIYSAWAKVRTRRYFYGNTWLQGHTFQYLASPLSILKGRIIVAAILVLYALPLPSPFNWLMPIAAVLVLPWLVLQALRFNAHNSAYRNLRFGFHGSLGGVFLLCLAWLFLFFITPFLIIAAISMYLEADLSLQGVLADLPLPEDTGLLPASGLSALGASILLVASLALPVVLWGYVLFRSWQYYAGGSAWGRRRFRFELESGPCLRMVVITVLLAMGALAIIAAGIGLIVTGYYLDFDTFVGNSLIALLSFGLAYLLLFYATAYYRAYSFNLFYRGVGLKENRLATSMTALSYFWLSLTNAIGIACSLGLFYPWARVRTARYRAARINARLVESLESYAAAEGRHVTALGDEMAEALDLGLGV